MRVGSASDFLLRIMRFFAANSPCQSVMSCRMACGERLGHEARSAVGRDQAQMARRTSSARALPWSASTTASPKSTAVPAPREVMIRPS